MPRPAALSALIAAEEAGELLTDAELRSMAITLMSAGHGLDEWLPPTEAVYGPVRLPMRYRPSARPTD